MSADLDRDSLQELHTQHIGDAVFLLQVLAIMSRIITGNLHRFERFK